MRKSERKLGITGNLSILGFCGIFLFGLYSTWVNGYPYFAKWVPVRGTFIDFQYTEIKKTKAGYCNKVTLTYEFFLNGNRFTSDRYSYFPVEGMCIGGEESRTQELKRKVIGKGVTIWVPNGEPAKATIERGPKLPLIAFSLAVALLVIFLLNKLRVSWLPKWV